MLKISDAVAVTAVQNTTDASARNCSTRSVGSNMRCHA